LLTQVAQVFLATTADQGHHPNLSWARVLLR
jgi:hypothetical protein